MNSTNEIIEENIKKPDNRMNKIFILVFNNIDKVILTLFNEPSLGLYYSQQHIDNSFSTLLYNLVNFLSYDLILG